MKNVCLIATNAVVVLHVTFVVMDIIGTHRKNALFVQIYSLIAFNVPIRNAKNAKIQPFIFQPLANASLATLLIITVLSAAPIRIAFPASRTPTIPTEYANYVMSLVKDALPVRLNRL